MTLTDDIPYDPFGPHYRPVVVAGGVTQSGGWCAPVDPMTYAPPREPRSPARERRRDRHRKWQHADRASRAPHVDALARDPRA